MKQSLLISIFIFLRLSFLHSQTSFSCTTRQYCYWNENSKIYQNCKGYDENSLFVVSKDERSFTHEIGSMKTSFSVTERQYDKENDTWTYQVTSPEGAKFVYTFDPRNQEIRFVSKKEEKTVMQIFTINSVF